MKTNPTKQLERNTVKSFAYVKEDMDDIYKVLRFFRREIRRVSLENKYLNSELRRLKLKVDMPRKELLY